jgi:hypothetical protein
VVLVFCVRGKVCVRRYSCAVYMCVHWVAYTQLQSETRELADEVESLAKVIQLNHDEKIGEIQFLKRYV